MEWTIPPPEIYVLNDGTTRVAIEGYEQTAIPGATSLPFTSTLIALPPDVIPSVHILSAEETTVPLPGSLAIAPQPEGALWDEVGHPIGPAFAPATRRLPAPLSPVTLEEAGILRGIRLARITFYPALPEGNRLRLIHRLRAEIRWSAARQAESLSYIDPLIRQVQQAVPNPWDAVPAPRPLAPALPRPAGGGTPTAFVEIASSGLYRVTYTDVAALGFGWANPQTLRLFRGDREVAYEWEGNGDAVFESGEAIVFYAEPRFSRWTGVDVYRLVADETPGLRMTTRPADPAGLAAGIPWVEQTFEDNRLYTPDRFTRGIPPGRDGDRWAWDYLIRPGHPAETYSFSLVAVNNTRPATLTLWLIGYTSGEHRWNVSINSTTVGQAAWAGKTGFTATLAIPPSVLQSGSNTLSVSLPVTSGAWLDAFAVRHARSTVTAGDSLRFAGESGPRAYTVSLTASGPYRAYDVTDPLRPIRLTGFRVDGQRITLGDPPGGGPRRYFVAAESSIRRPARIRAPEALWGFYIAGGGFSGADALIITHPEFADALGPLVTLRRSQGITITVANVLGVYDLYGDGCPDPESIRRFIAEAYKTWNPRPVYVLLVGDGSFDPKRYRPDSPPTFIPPYLADVDPWAGETAADNRYVCVDGDDNLPDLLLGRLPVKRADEARAVVQKIVDYETNPLPGGWNANIVLAADDADSAGNFAAFSDAAAVFVTSPFTVTRRYCAGASPYQSDCADTDSAALRRVLLADWNRGALVIQFAGHASWQQWAAERFFHLDDLPALRNARRYPVVAEMTCFTGAFHRPEPTLDESLVTLPDGGAIAAWGPTGLGIGPGHNSLSDGFFRAVFSDTLTTVGEAALAGKLALTASGQHLELLDTFVLLGDPSLHLNRDLVPWTAHIFLPLVQR